jgi:fermentation-respiration switch protein FrsA (DUF1100 family)
MTVFWIILVLLFILLCGTFYLCTLVLYPRKWTDEDTKKREIGLGHFDPVAFDAAPHEEVWINSPYGYKLYGIYLPAANSHKLVIMAHGFAYTLYGQAKYVNLFRSRGYHILLYDQRAHGRSGGRGATFGYYEKYDLKAVVDWAYEKVGPATTIGTMGESYGAGIVLQHGAIDPRVSFIVSDSAWSSLPDLLRYHLKKDYHLPEFPFLPLGNFLATVLTGMSFDTSMPISDMKEIQTPVFLIHGTKDTFIPPEMSRSLYNAKIYGIRKLYLSKDAQHGEAFTTHPLEYDQKLGEFLDSIED